MVDMSNEEADTILELLDLHQLTKSLRSRGWVAVPRAYAEKAYPEQVRTGWWPSLEGTEEHA